MAAQEQFSFDAKTDKIFHLMIHSLYEKQEIFLRELISNASDACDKLRYHALTKPELLEEGEEELSITITPDQATHTLTLTDNGIGMSRADLIKNLGTIARSGTQEFAERLTGDKQKDAQLIGQFGVGFYASFMVASKVEVHSRAAGAKSAHVWESKGDNHFTVTPSNETLARGTKIVLHLREGMEEYLDPHRIKHIVTSYSNHVAFPVWIAKEEGTEPERLNAGSALWTKPKKDITEEDYAEFYRDVSFMGQDTPWMTLHNQVEGVIEYTNLLFIPSHPPFDLFHPDRATRVKLYIKRVFIAEEGLELIPRYLRFLRGVIDSQDLPLNISRETVQDNAVLRKIRSGITKRVLKELTQKAEKQPEEYASFWENFGAVVKEGLCEATEPRDELLGACRFRSLNKPDSWISLAEYQASVAKDQEQIYYITGENVEQALASPQMEGFRERGIDVLLLTDSVDDFWVNVVTEYGGMPLCSITRSDVDLDALNEGKKSSEKEEESASEDAAKKEEHTPLLAFFKEELGEDVADVTLSARLKESPVCLSVPAGGMDMRMERFMVENRQLPGASAKVLEINPDHPIIQALAKQIAQKDALDTARERVQLLLDQATIVEGQPVRDAASFTKRLNQLVLAAGQAA